MRGETWAPRGLWHLGKVVGGNPYETNRLCAAVRVFAFARIGCTRNIADWNRSSGNADIFLGRGQPSRPTGHWKNHAADTYRTGISNPSRCQGDRSCYRNKTG